MRVKFQLFNIIRRQLTFMSKSAWNGATWTVDPPGTIVGQTGEAVADMPEGSFVEAAYYLQDEITAIFRFRCQLKGGRPVMTLSNTHENEYSLAYNYRSDPAELVVNVDYRDWPGVAPVGDEYRNLPSERGYRERGTVMNEPLTYMVTLTESGKWLHAPGSDFLFAYLDDSWSNELKEKVANAFTTALGMSSQIKQAVKDKTGQEVVNGLYLLNQSAMTEAMNSIDGMGQTSVDSKHESGSGTAVSINQQFFTAILAGLSGDVAPLMAYLTEEMGDVQAQTKKSTVTEVFGTVIGLVSLMPVLEVPVTTFQYVYSDSATSKWFVKVNCGGSEHYSYDYRYNVVNYNYDKPS